MNANSQEQNHEKISGGKEARGAAIFMVGEGQLYSIGLKKSMVKNSKKNRGGGLPPAPWFHPCLQVKGRQYKGKGVAVDVEYVILNSDFWTSTEQGFKNRLRFQ